MLGLPHCTSLSQILHAASLLPSHTVAAAYSFLFHSSTPQIAYRAPLSSSLTHPAAAATLLRAPIYMIPFRRPKRHMASSLTP